MIKIDDAITATNRLFEALAKLRKLKNSDYGLFKTASQQQILELKTDIIPAIQESKLILDQINSVDDIDYVTIDPLIKALGEIK